MAATIGSVIKGITASFGDSRKILSISLWPQTITFALCGLVGDIEALTQRILLIGKGKILLDGALEDLKARRSHYRTVTVDHNGQHLPRMEGVEILKDLGGHAQLRLDTDRLPMAKAIAQISAATEIKDFSVKGESIDDLVVSLYKEFEI